MRRMAREHSEVMMLHSKFASHEDEKSCKCTRAYLHGLSSPFLRYDNYSIGNSSDVQKRTINTGGSNSKRS